MEMRRAIGEAGDAFARMLLAETGRSGTRKGTKSLQTVLRGLVETGR
jgi:hypothetical protein